MVEEGAESQGERAKENPRELVWEILDRVGGMGHCKEARPRNKGVILESREGDRRYL